jgi:hypothetical protein
MNSSTRTPREIPEIHLVFGETDGETQGEIL